MADFVMVTHRVGVGAAITSVEDVQALLKAGINAVVDARQEFDDSGLLSNHPEILYLWNPAADDGFSKPTEWFQKAIDFSMGILSKPQGRLILHCAAGIQRGPSLGYAVLRAQGLDPNTAETLIRNARPQVGLAYKGDANRAIFELGWDDADFSKPLGA